MIDRNENYGRLWLWALVSASVAAMAFYKCADGDLGFHLATGRALLASGHIPATNVLSYTNPDQPWLLHQWLPATLFEWLWQHGGIRAVSCVKIAVVVFTFAVVYATCLARGATRFSAGACTLLGASAAAFRFEARPLLFTVALLALLSLLLAKALHAHRTTERRRLSVSALVVTAFACHVHAGAVDLFVVLLVTALGCAVEPLRATLLRAPVLAPSGLRDASRWLAVACGAALLAGLTLALYHPIGWRILLFPFDMATDAYLAEHLIEFRPPWRFPIAYLASFWLLLAACVACVFARARVVHAAALGVVLVFAALALKYVRMIYPFAVVVTPVLAAELSRVALARSAPIRSSLRTLLLCAMAITAPLLQWQKVEPGFGLVSRTWPTELFAFVRREHVHGPVFVSDAWAGPFLGFFYPEERAFFDNRIDAYPRAFVKDVYQRIRYAEPGYAALLERYGVELVLLRYTGDGEGRYQQGRDNLRQVLAADPRWALLTFDDEGELFVKRAGRNAALASRIGISGLDPDRLRFLVPPRTLAPRLSQLARPSQAGTRTLLLAALSAADAQQPEVARQLVLRAKLRAPDDAWIDDIARKIAAHALLRSR